MAPSNLARSSLARPTSNITGLSNMGGDSGAKDVDLPLSVVPKLSRIGVLVSPTSTWDHAMTESEAGAWKAGVKTMLAEVSTQEEIENAFSMMARGNAGAVIVGAAPFFSLRRSQLAELAIPYRMHSIFGNRAYVEAGGLMSYGQKVTNNYRRAASYVDKIVKGAKPGDLPVEQPVALELVIDQNPALKHLGSRFRRRCCSAPK